MVYLLIVITLLFLTVKGLCGKKTSCYVRDTGDAYLFNLLRMLFCGLIGLVLVFAEGAGAFLCVEWGMLAICALSGLSNAAFMVGWILAIRKNTMVSVDVGLTLGSLLPAILCALLFAEPISLPKMAGFALILLATVVLAGHGKRAEGRRVGDILLLIFAAVGEGLFSFTQQLYKQFYTEAGTLAAGRFYPKTVYHFYSYLFSALILLAVLIVYRIRARAGKPSGEKSAALPLGVVGFIFILALCMFAANYLQTIITSDFGMSSQMLYPIIKGGCLITVNFTAMLFFREKITRRSILGSLIALAGIVSMSIL